MYYIVINDKCIYYVVIEDKYMYLLHSYKDSMCF